MYFLIYGTILLIALSWWFITYVVQRKSDLKELEEPEWTSFVEEFKKDAPEMQSHDQLNEYLTDVNEKIKMFETDYAFLVAFNTILREIKDRLEPSKIISESRY